MGGVSTPAPTGLVQQLLESTLTARAGPQIAAHGATVLGAQPRTTLVAGPGCACRSRAPAVSTGLIAGAHIEGGTYLGGCGVALVLWRGSNEGQHCCGVQGGCRAVGGVKES